MFVSLAGPTSPAYSCGPGVRTEPGCFADRSFSTQAYKPRVLTDITRLRVAVPKTSFFCCLHLSSIRVSRSFPHRLADVRISVSTCFIRCYGVARGVLEDGGATARPRLALGARRNGPRGLSSARPDAHRSVFFPYRSPACGVQCNRSSPRFERGAPNFARALTFLPRNTCRFADFASSGLQRPQTTFPSC